jgi:hypothetical protein
MYKLGWDALGVWGVDESLLDIPVAKQVHRHITCFGAQQIEPATCLFVA